MKGILEFLLIILLFFASGYVVLNFWGWFLLPVFPSLPVITFWQAVGLSMTGSVLTGNVRFELKDITDEYDDTSKIIYNIFGWLITLGLGWIVSCMI